MWYTTASPRAVSGGRKEVQLLIRAAESALVVSDMQDRLVSAMQAPARTIRNARRLIAAAREMIAANRQLKAGLRYSRVASVLAYGGVVLIAVLLIIRGDR